MVSAQSRCVINQLECEGVSGPLGDKRVGVGEPRGNALEPPCPGTPAVSLGGGTALQGLALGLLCLLEVLGTPLA